MKYVITFLAAIVLLAVVPVEAKPFKCHPSWTAGTLTKHGGCGLMNFKKAKGAQFPS